MTERRRTDRSPIDRPIERSQSDRRRTDGAPSNQPERATAQEWLDGMREARHAERAPEAVRERLLERARELSRSSEEQGTWPLRAVENRAGRERWSLPIGIVPLLERPLFERPLFERALFERALRERPLRERPLRESWLGEQGGLGALTHPLLARIAGAALMVGLVVLVIADTRGGPRGIPRPVNDGAVNDGAVTNGAVTNGAAANDRAPGSPQSLAPHAAGASASWAPQLSLGQLPAGQLPVGQLPAANDAPASTPASEPPPFGGEAAGDLRYPRVAPSEGEARRVLAARALLDEQLLDGHLVDEHLVDEHLVDEHLGRSSWGDAPRTPNDVRRTLGRFGQQLAGGASRAGAPLPVGSLPALPVGALPALPVPADLDAPWLSPSAALRAIRSVATPFLRDDSMYPRGTRVVARGNVRPESLSPERTRNFITNGDFSRGDVMWSVRSWQGFGDTSVAAYYSVQAGALCTALDRNQQVMGGWPWDDRRLNPSSFELEPGQRYRLSLRAWSSGPELVELVVKVGHQKEPYTPALVAKVPLQAEPGLFDIDFVAARRDTVAGFAFVATSPRDQPHSEFCIDDVSVRPIADIH